MDQDLFVILSVINTGNNPWSYINVRSVFSAEDRFLQTLETIASIRKYRQTAKILLVECSPLPDEKKRKLGGLVEYYTNIYENSTDEARENCLQSDKKGLGEAYQTKCAIKFIQENSIRFRRLFKISGRYSLNDEFDEKRYSDSAYTFKLRVEQVTPSHSTVLYSVPFQYLEQYLMSASMSLQFYLSGQNRGWEEVLPPLLEPKIELDRMGAQGLVAVNGDFFTC